MSDNYDSADEGSIHLARNNPVENMLSPSNAGLGNSEQEPSDNVSAYRPPLTQHFQSYSQNLLGEFLYQFKEQAGLDSNKRGVVGRADDSNDEEVLQDEQNKFNLFQYNSPNDASGCTKIQTMKEYINGIETEQKNPKTNFFDLSREYYTGRFKGDNKRTIVVKSYLITEDHENFVKDLSMEIIQTNQGCMPIIKTFEFNAYQSHKFVKALKVYNYKGDCKLKKQIIVDEGVMTDKFRTYDTSLLHFGNTIIFYKREENWHKLQTFDVVTNELKEIPGYNIEEPIGDGIHYHLMFSSEFGVKRSKQVKSDLRKKDPLQDFLQKHYVFAQSFQITEDIQYVNKSLIGFKMVQQDTKQANRTHLPEFNQPRPRRDMDAKPLELPVQYMCHIHDEKTGHIKFIAFDSFSSHHFIYDPFNNNQKEYQTFFGNNETHMQPSNKEILQDINMDQQDKHDSLFSPFLKHQNAQFTIQREKVTLSIIENDKEIDQYFYMSNENQYMLIYPNYENTEQKNQVIFQLAKRFQHNPNPDIDYDYQDDYEVRIREYLECRIKKVSHICINAYRSKNYMKRAQHIKDIVDYNRDLLFNDKVILSTDQQTNLIYIYQSSNVFQGENKIDIFNYENNIVNTKNATTLPKQIAKSQELLNKNLGGDPGEVFYVNAKFRQVISSINHIKTEQKTQRKRKRDQLNRLEQMELEEMIEKNPNCKEQYEDLNHFILREHRDTFAIVEDTKGSYMSIRIKQDSLKEHVSLIMYSRNKTWYTFILTIGKSPKKLYFALRMSIADVEDLGENNNNSLIQDMKEQKVTVFLSNQYHQETEKENLKAYTEKMTFLELIELQKKPQDWLVNLTFELAFDNKSQIDFIPMIYQERSGSRTHHLLSFDVQRMEVVRHYNLLANKSIRGHLRKSQQGFGVYTLTRTSDIYSQKSGMFLGHTCNNNISEQIVKYQVSAQFYMKNIRLPEKYNDMDDNSELNPANCTLELSEYLIHFSCCDQNRLQLVGMKQLLVSESAMDQRRDTFKNVILCPWFDKKSIIKGSQFALREDEDMQVIRLIDQDINALYQHCSETIQYGHQKFLTSIENHDDYILVISSQLKQRVQMGQYFDNSESYWIHQKTIKKLLSMQLAKFEYFVLNDDFEQLMREEFYQAQEVLQGKSINDLCLGFPREVAQGLKQPEIQYSSIAGSLIEEVCNGEEATMASYEEMGLCEKNLLVQLDFNFCSSIRMAAEINSNQSVKMLLSKIFELNDVKYQEIFMLEIPKLLQMPRIERLYDFLTRDADEKAANDDERAKAQSSDNSLVQSKFLNFEDVLNHPNLETYLSEKCNYHLKYRFDDHHDQSLEIVNDLKNRTDYISLKVKSLKDFLKIKKKKQVLSAEEAEEEEKKEEVPAPHDDSEQIQRNVEVEYSAINFFKVIIGEKIRGIQDEEYRQINFNDNHLASIFWVEDEESMNFYDLEAVRKIVDFQYVRTQGFLKFIMFFYFVGFLVPFTITLSCETAFFLNILYIICLFTQIFFMIFESMQIKEQRLNYFMDFWNLIDSSQFLFFLILYIIKMKNQFQTDSMFEIILQSLLLLQTFWKALYFARVFESFNRIYQMSLLVATDVISYGVIAFLFLVAFTKQFTVMHLGINDANGEYASIGSPFVKLMVQTYKSARGEVVIPKLDENMQKRTEGNFLYKDIMLTFNMVIWGFQQALFIFLAAAFVSGVLQSFEKWRPLINTYLYKAKAKFNNECYDIVDMFLPQRNFKVICFALSKEREKQEYSGFINKIQKSITTAEENQLRLRREQEKIAVERFQKLNHTKVCVSKLQTQINVIEQLLSGPGPNSRCNCQRI